MDTFILVVPKGTWKIYIYNMGSAFTDVSTATAQMTVIRFRNFSAALSSTAIVFLSTLNF